MARKSISEIMTMAQRGAGIKISAATYSASEIVTLATHIQPGCYLIVTDAAVASSSALASIMSQIKGQVIFDYS